MKTDGQSDLALLHRSYWWLCAALLATTLCEWAVFVERHLWGVSERVLVPSLLVTSGAKCLFAIAWLIKAPAQLDAGRKSFLVALIMGGGAPILLLLLMR